MKKALWSSLGLLALATSAHAADESNWYIGVSAGAVDYDLNVTNAERHVPFTDASGNPISTDLYRFQTSTSAYQLFEGYRFNRYIAAELNLATLGTVHRNGDFHFTNAQGQPSLLVSRTQFEPKGVGLSVLGFWPINADFEAFGRAGLFDWRINGPFKLVQNGVQVLSGGPHDTGVDPFFGVGGVYHWDQFSLRLEYQHYTFDHPFNAANNADSNSINVGVSYSF